MIVVSVSKPSAASGDLHMIAGSNNPCVDRSGRTWGPGRFFSGNSVLVRRSEKIFRTFDSDIYRHIPQGCFRYDIPLEPGFCELHLNFAEVGLSDFIGAESSGEGQHVFQVSANEKSILNVLDVVADAAGSGAPTARSKSAWVKPRVLFE